MIPKCAADSQQTGKLYYSHSGWVCLSVPNALARGVFSSLDEPGVELPPSSDSGAFNAHISVMRPEEVEQIGGAYKITERGRDFNYIIGKLKTVPPSGWPEMSKAWILPVRSLPLERLRKSYGLPPLPKFPFHITVAVRRKAVLQNNAVGKGNNAPHLSGLDRDGSGSTSHRQTVDAVGSALQAQYTGAVGPGKSYLGRIGSKAANTDGVPKAAAAETVADRKTVDDGVSNCRDDGWRRFVDAMGGLTKSAVTIPGIPDIGDLGDLSKLQAGQLLDFVIQKHKAQRAGEHFDIRFGTPELGAYSWATRKELPDVKKKIALFQQPLHHHGYMPFQGTLHGGYGAGTVRTHKKGKILITKVSPNRISFTMAGQRHPERFALIKPRSFKDKTWLLVNTTPVEATPYNKVHYTKIPQEQVESALSKMREGDSAQAKIDGAASLIKLMENGVEVMSYRVAKETGRPIIHTERVFHGRRPELKIPKELVGTVLKGEIYGERQIDPTLRTGGQSTDSLRTGIGAEAAAEEGRRSIPPQELGGILNATIANSIEKQKAQKVKLKQMVYDIQQLGKEPVAAGTTYADRMEMLRKVLPHLPKDVFHLPDAAETQEEALALWKRIQAGKHPLTEEGIVIHPRTGKPKKIKQLEEQDVWVTGVFPGEGKYRGTGAGGLTYSRGPGGQTVGRIGTGFTDEFRRELQADPAAYIGRLARVKSQGAFPSGALRAPAFHSLHEDYPTKAAAETAQNPLRQLLAKTASTIAVDLDGTLAKHYDKYEADHIPDPRPGAKAAMQELKDAGHTIIIHTVRGDKKLVKAWLMKHDIVYDHINDNPNQPADASHKPIADLYVDDRGVDARASWKKLVQTIKRRVKPDSHN